MLCKKCHNLLTKITTGTQPKFTCQACGSEYPASGTDTLIFSEGTKFTGIRKSGRVIYGIAANAKVRYPGGCPKCKAEIVAWEKDSHMNKVYGCLCGHAWTLTTTE